MLFYKEIEKKERKKKQNLYLFYISFVHGKKTLSLALTLN